MNAVRSRAVPGAAALLACVSCAQAHAATARAPTGALVASGVGAGAAIPSFGIGGIAQALFGLILVLAAVFCCAWLARRLGWQRPGESSVIKIVGAASLSQRERVVVVEVAGTWLVLGVAPGSVRRLHTLPAGDLPQPAGAGMSAAFAQTLRKQLSGRLGDKSATREDR